MPLISLSPSLSLSLSRSPSNCHSPRGCVSPGFVFYLSTVYFYTHYFPPSIPLHLSHFLLFSSDRAIYIPPTPSNTPALPFLVCSCSYSLSLLSLFLLCLCMGPQYISTYLLNVGECLHLTDGFSYCHTYTHIHTLCVIEKPACVDCSSPKYMFVLCVFVRACMRACEQMRD